MKKQQRTDPVIVIEWNCETASDTLPNSGDGLSKEDLRNLARALGRMAAQRDLAILREDRARSIPNSDVNPGKIPAKALT